MPKLNWYLHRLRAMDGAEVFGRAREKLRHKTERFAAVALRGVRPGSVSGEVPALPARADAPSGLRETLAGDAARLLAGKWALFGWNEAQLPSPPEWRRDYTCGVDVPVGGRKVDHRALPGGADARAIWEINRWAEMVRLAMHGWLNDDVAAILRAQEWLADWVEKNPLGKGVNWTSVLEGGLRLINFCWFDALVRQQATGGGQGRDECLERQEKLTELIVPGHVWWLHRYLSFGSSANNHRLGELTGLLLAVKRWPELERVARPAGELWEEIEDCVLAQFAEDGGNREQALHYHLFAFEMALHASRAMNVTDGPVTGRLERAAEFFVRMAHPQEPWDYGDSDDAQIVPLTMRREKAVAEWGAWMSGSSTGLQPVCRTGILPVRQSDDTGSSLRYWLGEFKNREMCGDPGQNARATHRLQACATSWWVAPESGMAVCERDGLKVRVDASPLGFGKIAAHGHCDALHVSIWDGEHALVIDPGTGCYFGSKEMRAGLASWNAHNGPQPAGGFKTPRRVGTFLWAEHPARPVCSIGKDGMSLRFRHEGLDISRRVAFLEGGRIEVRDFSFNQGLIRVSWQLAPGCEVLGLDPKAGVVGISRGNLHWRVTFPDACPELSIRQSQVSRCFGRVEQAPTIDVTFESGLRTVWQRTTGQGVSAWR